MSDLVLKLFFLVWLACGFALQAEAVDDQQQGGSNSNQQIPLFALSQLAGLENWEPVEFEGQTEYRWITLEGQRVLRAHSQASASGYLLEQEIDLRKFPYLNWRWRVEKRLPMLDELKKSGDDYVARIYLLVSGRWFFWQTKALNYVWSSRGVKGQSWPNAYAPDNARMLAVRDNTDVSDVWYSERRHVLSDIQSWLGEDVTHIDGVAIMTDSDDSQLEAIGYYAEIFFSAQ